MGWTGRQAPGARHASTGRCSPLMCVSDCDLCPAAFQRMTPWSQRKRLFSSSQEIAGFSRCCYQGAGDPLLCLSGARYQNSSAVMTMFFVDTIKSRYLHRRSALRINIQGDRNLRHTVEQRNQSAMRRSPRKLVGPVAVVAVRWNDRK